MDDGRSPARASALETMLLGGLAIGVLDMLDAFTFFGWFMEIGGQRVFQGVAAGLIGVEAARSGGWSTFWLGLGLHYVTATCVAAAYYVCTRLIPWTLNHAVVSGLVFGVVAHFVMQCVVIPLSAIHRWPPTFPLLPTLNGVIGHALLVGLPVALIAAWSARRHSLK